MTSQQVWLIVASLAAVTLILSAVVILLRRCLACSQAQKRAIESRYRTILEQADEGIFVIDADSGRILEANRALQRRLGYSGAELLALKLDDILIEAVSGLNTVAIERLTNTRSGARTLKHRCKNGTLLEVEVTAGQLDIDGRKALCYIAHDVSARKIIEKRLLRNQRRMKHLAHHDALTGLPNRLLLRIYLEAILVRAADDGFAVMILDLDDFKSINDVRGHHVGDQLLVDVATQLKNHLGNRGMAARLGGDEFVVVLRDISNARDAAADARAIQSLLADSLQGSTHETDISVSIGISLYPQDARDAGSLPRHADLAMYKAKENGRNNVQVFNVEMHRQVRRRVALERAMRRALKAGEFTVHYQPLVAVASRRIVSLEALIRWRHPRLGQISPARFIPVAEQSGVILQIGEMVLRNVCRQLQQWKQEGVPIVPVAVNWSVIQLQRQNVFELVRRVLDEIPIDPQLLAFEITEGALMQDVHRHASVLRSLRDLGIRIQIDDFGTGYSSLSYLRHLPIDTLKIDRSFISQVDVNTADQAIVSAVFAMARSLELRVVAEGVETEAQLEALNRHNCEIAQGYFFSHPLPADQCSALLRELAIRPSFTDTLRMRVHNGLPLRTVRYAVPA